MVYCVSHKSHDSLCSSLIATNPLELRDYFDTNWHEMRDQWSLFGQRPVFNLINRTNNRLERFNKTFYDVCSKSGEINSSFKNIM